MFVLISVLSILTIIVAAIILGNRGIQNDIKGFDSTSVGNNIDEKQPPKEIDKKFNQLAESFEALQEKEQIARSNIIRILQNNATPVQSRPVEEAIRQEDHFEWEEKDGVWYFKNIAKVAEDDYNFYSIRHNNYSHYRKVYAGEQLSPIISKFGYSGEIFTQAPAAGVFVWTCTDYAGYCIRIKPGDCIMKIDTTPEGLEEMRDWERKQEEERIAAAKRQEEYEKREIARKIKEKHRRRELEKIVRQELIDSGELFGDAPKRPPIPREVVDAVYRRDGGRCVYCGSTENLQIDHIIPFSKGGASTVENLQLLCAKCNREKSDHIG